MSSTSLPSSSSLGASTFSEELRFKSRYLLLSLFVLVVDQWSKWMIELHLDHHTSQTVIPDLLNFTHVQNTGVAFGLFAAKGSFSGTMALTALGLAALGFVGYYFWLVPRHDRTLLVSLALVIGGAIGNLLDRVMHGGVTDFIDVYFGSYHWHTFNVADTAISVGIGLMILGTFLHKDEDQSEGGESTPSANPG